MEFIETKWFSGRADQHLGPEGVRALQIALLGRPDLGVLVPGLGGVRKLRWSGSGRGKRGGIRVLYFLAVRRGVVLLLHVFAKNEQGDLNPDQKRVLVAVVKKEFG